MQNEEYTLSYCNTFISRHLVLFSIINGLMASYIYLIATGAPFIAIDNIGISPTTYSLLFLIPYSGQLIGSLTAGKLNKKFSACQIITVALGITLGGVTLIFISFLLHWVNIHSLIIPFFFIMFSLPLSYGSVTVMAMINYNDKATASAIISFLTLLVSLAITFILTLLPQGNVIILPSLFLLVIIQILAISLFWLVCRYYDDTRSAIAN